ncbi:hypothetical protein C8Q78DRAFT_1188679 [Trametes maxima]|nr:hypothetical protein C8Q78DRAFT_1188679 [Trametes maxima]
MPPRPSLPTSSPSFYPANDVSTHRDLMMFEERLKSNAAKLNRRKRRYQLFLFQLLIIILFLLCEVWLQTNLLGIPCKWVLHQVLPEIYTSDTDVRVPPYFTSGLLFVSVTTLVLFFASGMYKEKIAYANKYVPQANRALRNFNMHLNMRQPPLRTKIPFNPFAFLFARPSEPPSPTSPTSQHMRRTRSPSPSRGSIRRSSSVPIPSIPPASNPRGELIFSSRVDRSFRESYDRYRAQFERRREVRERMEYAQTWVGWLHLKMPWMRQPAAGSGAATPVGAGKGPGWAGGHGASALRGRTPDGSRKSSPAPGRSPRKVSGRSPPTPRPSAEGPLTEKT